MNMKTFCLMTFLVMLSASNLVKSEENASKLDDYVLTTQSECYKSKKILSCFKYRISRYIWTFAAGNMKIFADENGENRGTGLQIVRLNSPEVDDVFNEARASGNYC